MRIAITGSKGQLGTALQQVLRSHELLLVDLPEYDIADLQSVLRSVGGFRPRVVIHAAAITDVDGCERDPESAYRVNVLGTRNITVAAQGVGAAVLYVSTDYVFDGARGEPYWEYDEAHPLSVYGRTKWVGEQLVRNLCTRHYVVRTAWLYGSGTRNFVQAVLRLAREQRRLHMVTDEVGSPTYAADLACAIAQVIRQPAYGNYHLPNAGACSRFDWAREILSLTGQTAVELVPAENYQRAARVPKRVELRNFAGSELGIVMRPWREALRAYIQSTRGL